MNKKRLAIVQWGSYRAFPIGGISTFVESILPGLGEAFDLKLVGMSMGEPLGRWTEITVEGRAYEFLPVVDPVSCQMIPDRLRLAWAIHKFRDELLAAKADAYYVHMTEAALPLLFCGAPVIIHVHGLYNLFHYSRHFLGKPFSYLYKNLYPFLFSKCARVIGAGTASEFEDFTQTMWVKSGVLVPTCVRERVFCPRDRNMVRRRLGIAETDLLLLYVGRFTETKNPLLLLDVARLLRRRWANLKVVFVGDGPLRSQLEDAAGRSPNILVMGPLCADEIALWMNAANLVAIVSKTEAFTSIVALEALSCGTPVVATPVGALPEVITNGVNGWISTSFSPEAYSVAVERALCAVPSSEQCRQSVSTYSSESVSAQIVREIETVLESDSFVNAVYCVQ